MLSMSGTLCFFVPIIVKSLQFHNASAQYPVDIYCYGMHIVIVFPNIQDVPSICLRVRVSNMFNCKDIFLK